MVRPDVDEDMRTDRTWHLDKRVNLALLFAVFLQTAGAFWWASATNTRLENVEKQAAVTASSTLPQAERLIRVEEKVGVIKEDIAEIKTLIRSKPN